MYLLREILSVLFFIAGIALLVQISGIGLQWWFLAGGLACFVTAYIVWPSKKRGTRETGHWLLDIVEVIIELPVETFLWLFRFLGRFFRSKDSGLDIDLDF